MSTDKGSKLRIELFRDFLIGEIVRGSKEKSLIDFQFIDMTQKGSLSEYIKWDNDRPTANLWLKARLFEQIVASAGLDDYLRGLLTYKGDKPESDVLINPLLASALIASSLNRFALELLKKQRAQGKLSTTQSQVEALSKIYEPQRDFTTFASQTNFTIDQVEDAKNALLRISLDMLATQNRLDSKEFRAPIKRDVFAEVDRVPANLVKVGSIPPISISQLNHLSVDYGSSLKLSIADGYILWKYRGEPTMYLKDGHAYYASSETKLLRTNERKLAERQLYLIREKLQPAVQYPSVLCSICQNVPTSILMYHREKGVIPVCEKCAKDPMVVGEVARIGEKGSMLKG